MDPKRKLQLARLLSRLDHMKPGEPFPEVKDGRPIGEGFRIGITGPVGAGKSSMINRLAREIRNRDQSLGIIAVDPSSPFTGGAVLGDRIRMTDVALDEETFIRSLATRGSFGGLAENAVDAADLLDTFGFNRIIIETVGVGQTEVDIVEACDITVVLLEPSSGDGVQAIKAGLMEIADVFVVNKMDLKGAQRFVADLETSIHIKAPEADIKIFPIQSTNGDGISEFCDYLDEFHKRVSESGDLHSKRIGQRAKRIKRLAEGIVMRRIWEDLPTEELENAATNDIPAREAARMIVDKFISLKVM